MGLQKNYSPDVGFHLQSAKWMIDHKSFISTDPFTYTSFGNTYYDLQWVYQLFLYGIYKIGKDALLVIINSLLIACSFVMIGLRAKHKGLKKMALFSILCVFTAQALPFEIRPQVFSWLYLGFLLFILERYKSDKEQKLYFMPIIMLLWINSHSLAILGLVTIMLFYIGLYFENKKHDKVFLRFAAMSLAAFLINPYFIEGFMLPFTQLGIIKGDLLQKTYIGELQSPFTTQELKTQGWWYLANPLLYMQLYSLLALFVAIKDLFKKRFTESFLVGTFFVITAMAMKNYGYFLVVSLPVVSIRIQSWIEKRKANKKPGIAGRNNGLDIAALCLPVLISWLCFTDGLSILKQSPYHFGVSTDKGSVPVEATGFLNENKIYGKVLNHLDFGGYLMYNYPEKVFIDGRLELPKKEFFRKYFNSLKPGGIQDLMAEYDPEIIIFPYVKATGWWSYLIGNKNYRPVYFDGLAAIYIKQGKFAAVPALNDSMINSSITTNLDLNRLMEAERPSRLMATVKSLWEKQYFPIEEQNKATYCFTYGYNKAALHYSAQGLERTTVLPKDIYYNLALYFKDAGQFDTAELCRRKSK